MAPPRLFGIPATDAPVVAVVRRGPTDWCSVGVWDLVGMEYRQGSWLQGTLYPQRCDVSPDGRWLAYFCLKASADWAPGSTYLAVSRLPWLTALVAWGTDGTWTSGLHFTADREAWPGAPPDVGDPRPLRERYGLAPSRAETFAVERRRGWSETLDTPARADDDVWDERRDVAVEKRSPPDDSRLVARGSYAAWRSFGPGRFDRSTYALDDGHGERVLDDVQWADWSVDASLLVATVSGELQCRTSDARTVRWRVDLSAMQPDPSPPPREAADW